METEGLSSGNAVSQSISGRLGHQAGDWTPAPSFLTSDECDSAETTLLRLSQRKTYCDVLLYLQDHGKLPVKHPCWVSSFSERRWDPQS